MNFLANSDSYVQPVGDCDRFGNLDQRLELQMLAHRQLLERFLPVVQLAHPEAHEGSLVYLCLGVDRVLDPVAEDALPAVEVCMRPQVVPQRRRPVNLVKELPAHAIVRECLLILIDDLLQVVDRLVKHLLERLGQEKFFVVAGFLVRRPRFRIGFVLLQLFASLIETLWILD